MNIAKRTIRFWKEVFSKFSRDGCMLKAQSLSYITVFSLVPLSAISFSIFSKFQAFSALEAKVKSLIFNNFLPSSSAKIQSYIAEFMEKTTVLSIFGVGTLVIASVLFLDAVEGTFNDIWGVKERRPWLRRFASFWSFITLAPFFLALSIYLSSFVMKHIPIEGYSLLRWVSYHSVSIVLAWVAFFLGYYFLPYTDVDVKSALKGSLFTAVLWEIVKKGFDWYITHMTNFGKIYGSLGLIPVFLFWIYIVWVIVLLGGEVTFLLEWPSGKKPDLPYFSLKLLLMLADRYTKGYGPVKVKDLVKKCGVDRKKLLSVLETFTAAGWVACTDGSYIMAMPPEKIKLSEVLEKTGIVNFTIPPEENDAYSRAIKTIEEHLRESLSHETRDLTLKKILLWIE